MPYRFDASRHPIVLIEFVGHTTDEEFDQYLAEMTTTVLDRKQKNVTIIDASKSAGTSPMQRRKQADWLGANEEPLRRYSLGTAFVIQSPVVRGVLSAILWLRPMAAPHVVVKSRADAERWAHEKLVLAGLAPSAVSP